MIKSKFGGAVRAKLQVRDLIKYWHFCMAQKHFPSMVTESKSPLLLGYILTKCRRKGYQRLYGMALEVVITEWALQSYLELVTKGILPERDYRKTIRPDVTLLKQYPRSPKFKQPTFWSPATLRGGERVERGYKMKWHNVGPGSVQLRLCVAMLKNKAFLCQAYVKDSEAKDKRQAVLLLQRIDLVEQGQFDYRGNL